MTAVCVSRDRYGIRAASWTALINIGFFAIAPERPNSTKSTTTIRCITILRTSWGDQSSLGSGGCAHFSPDMIPGRCPHHRSVHSWRVRILQHPLFAGVRFRGVRISPLRILPQFGQDGSRANFKQSPVEPSEPRHGVEMSVAAHDREGVLTAQRCNPNVIRWNRCSGLL